VLDKIARNI